MPKYQEVRLPFQNMSFTPDVPATALQPNEYNAGSNIETDVRGIRSVFGDQEILASVPGTGIFITGDYRSDGDFWFVVATQQGKYWASKGEAWQDITPNGGTFAGYTQETNITNSWNGTVAFFNDTLNPPMFWPDEPGAIMVAYSNQNPLTIDTIAAGTTPGTNVLTWKAGTIFTEDPPFPVGGYINISGIIPPDQSQLNGNFLVTAQTYTPPAGNVQASGSVTYTSSVTGTYNNATSVSTAKIAPQYNWNYNPNWKTLTASFMRLYATPNVGCILVAGNLSGIDINDKPFAFPVTVQWSQAFGLNAAPQTWTPTITNVANQLEIPLRGPAIDAFKSNGNFYIQSYWDTVVFSPINYSTTSAPILGVSLYTTGRGMLSSNCFAVADNTVYGIDARDIWKFDGSSFSSLGNQRVKNYLFEQLNPDHIGAAYMVNNTEKNQIEFYYTDKTSTNGIPNKMLSYRYDLDIFNPPRDVSNATFACESPIWSGSGSTYNFNYGSRCIVYAQGVYNQFIVQKDQGYTFIDNTPITSVFQRDNIKILPSYSGHLLVHRIFPEIVNLDTNGVPLTPGPGNVTVQISGSDSVGSSPVPRPPVIVQVDTEQPWAQINQNAFRVNQLKLTNTSNTNAWLCSATSWQYTQTQDDQ